MSGSNLTRKAIVAHTSVAAAVITALVGWQNADFLPRWAWHSELEQVVVEQETLKSVLYNDMMLRLRRELNEIERRIWQAKKDKEEVPQWMVREKATLEAQIERLERDIKQLRESEESGG